MSIRTLFWLTVALALLVPLFSIGGLRLYEVSLLRTTERQLIAQSVVVGEMYRSELGLLGSDPRPPAVDERFVPREPRITGSTENSPSLVFNQPCEAALDRPELRERLNTFLSQTQVQNLSSLRILDPKGCALASTRGELDIDFSKAPEVKQALRGKYGYALRARISDEPLPPLESIQRRGRARVFTALPLFADGKLIGVVRASRTGLDPLSRLFEARRSYLSLAALLLVSLFILALAGSASIVRPLRSLTQHARRLQSGVRGARWQPGLLAPKETVLLGHVLDDASEALHARADAIAAFARDVSHELKTPITAVRGAAELLRDSALSMSDEQRKRFADNIVQDSTRMSRLVERLLVLARLDHPNAFESGEPLDPMPWLLHEAQRDARVELTTAGEPGSIVAPSEYFESLVGNLVDNALQHGQGRVLLSATFSPQQLKIEVSDEGPGIRTELLEQIFEPFFTTARNRGGTGLGLSIARALAQGMGGDLLVRSSPEGSSFVLTLPRHEVSSERGRG